MAHSVVDVGASAPLVKRRRTRSFPRIRALIARASGECVHTDWCLVRTRDDTSRPVRSRAERRAMRLLLEEQRSDRRRLQSIANVVPSRVAQEAAALKLEALPVAPVEHSPTAVEEAAASRDGELRAAVGASKAKSETASPTDKAPTEQQAEPGASSEQQETFQAVVMRAASNLEAKVGVPVGPTLAAVCVVVAAILFAVPLGLASRSGRRPARRPARRSAGV